MTELHPSIPALLEFFTDENLPVGPQKDLATTWSAISVRRRVPALALS